MLQKQSIAIITARGGSKRIPKKNIKDFCGKPILAYSIEAALESKLFSEVMVSTDSEEIAEVAKKYGAAVPFMRSERTSNDFATTADVLSEVVEEYEKRREVFDVFCCIYPTAPFVTADKLTSAMQLLKVPDVDSVMAVTQFSFPPMRGMYIRDKYLKYCHPECSRVRSQDLEPVYHDCGQFYCMKTEAFLREKKLVTERTKGFLIPESEVQDIDTLEDWKMAELKFERMYQREGQK